MKYFRLTTDNSKWFAGESVFTEILMKRMLRELPKSEAKIQKFEEVTKEEAFKQNGYYLVNASDFDGGNSGEKNVFYDVNGNEWHN